MRVVGVIIIAYLLSGAWYVLRDFLRPIDSRPSYIRHERGVEAKMFIVLFWLPATLSFAFRGGYMPSLVLQWAIFVGLIFAGLALTP